MGALHDLEGLSADKKALVRDLTWLDDEGVWACTRRRLLFSFEYIDGHDVEEIERDIVEISAHQEGGCWAALFNQPAPGVVERILKKLNR